MKGKALVITSEPKNLKKFGDKILNILAYDFTGFYELSVALS
jgi:hypothetical protein